MKKSTIVRKVGKAIILIVVGYVLLVIRFMRDDPPKYNIVISSLVFVGLIYLIEGMIKRRNEKDQQNRNSVSNDQNLPS